MPTKKILLITVMLIGICLNSSLLLAQTTTYTGGTIKITKNGAEKPLGKSVTLKYDSFFKSYDITYYDVNGYKNRMLFEYSRAGFVTYQYIDYSVIEVFLPKSGMISFADVRRYGTGVTYSITGLKVKK